MYYSVERSIEGIWSRYDDQIFTSFKNAETHLHNLKSSRTLAVLDWRISILRVIK